MDKELAQPIIDDFIKGLTFFEDISEKAYILKMRKQKKHLEKR